MKMKDVCVKTGLTERAVRFYADKDLIHPKKTKVNGRENWEFDEKDVEELLYIAKLRKAEFTVQEIKEMRENADNIPGILSKQYAMIIERHESDAELLRELMNLQNSANQDWKTIGKRLFQGMHIEKSDFAQFDEEIEVRFTRECSIKKHVLVLLTFVPIVVGIIMNNTAFLPIIGPLLNFVLPVATTIFWFWLGMQFARSTWKTVLGLLIGNATGIISLVMLLLTAEKVPTLFLWAQMFGTSAPGYILMRLAVLFDSTPNTLGADTIIVYQVICCTYMILVFSIAFLMGKMKTRTEIIEKIREDWESSTETQNFLRVLAGIVLLVGVIGQSILGFYKGNIFWGICFGIVILLILIIKLVGDDRR